MPSQAVQDAIARMSVAKTKAQTGAMAAKVQAQGGSVKKGGPSILSRIFDVISRPMYAVDEPIARLAEGKGVGDVARGVVSGLAGKSKTDVGSIIERGHGGAFQSINRNKPLKAGLSLVGDVLTDPLTYVGGGVVKAGGEGLAKTAKLGAIAEHFAKPETIRAIEEAGQVAKGTKEAGYAAKGVDVAEKEKTIAKAVGKGESAARRAAYPEALKAGEAAYAGAKTDAPGKVVLKMFGKPVAESEKAYSAVAKAGKAVAGTKAGALANEAFRTSFKFPEMTNVIKRESQLRGIAKAEQDMRGVKSIFKDLKPHELELVTHAAEKGPVTNPITSEVATSSLHGVKAENGKDLGTYVDEARKILDERLQHEVDTGVHLDKKTGRPLTFSEARRENYVPHYYKTAENDAQALKKLKAIGADRPGFTMPRSIESLAHAKSLGLDPVLPIDDILMKRIGASHGGIARAEWSKQVAEHFGVDTNNNEVKKLFATKEGRANLKELGYKSVDSPYVPKTTLFPAHIADSYKAMEAMHGSDKLVGEFLKHFDKVQNQWKFWNTAANPGHHVRNLVGDAWNNFVLGGVTNPERYATAGKIVYGDPEKVAVKVGERTFSGTDILRHNVEAGAKPGFTLGELQADPSGGLGKAYHGFKGTVGNIAEKREDFTRMANFIEQFKKEGANLTKDSTEKDIREAASRAGAKVRKINIDYGDMTDFEKTKLKRIMPFYTWTRKNLPLQLEALALHPGRVATIPKGQAAIQRLLGTDKGYNAGPLDSIPKWLKEMSPIDLGGSKFGVPALPFNDIGKFAEGGKSGVLRNLLSQTNPAIRIPVEQAMGQAAFSGAPVGSNTSYLASQLSPVNQIYKLLTGKQKVMSPQTLNYLTGAGVYKVTPGQQAAELRRQQVPLKASIRNAKKKAAGG